jgi:hypothetical protein
MNKINGKVSRCRSRDVSNERILVMFVKFRKERRTTSANVKQQNVEAAADCRAVADRRR